MTKVKALSLSVRECYTPVADGSITISGLLVLDLLQEVEVKRLSIKLKGQSECDWVVPRMRGELTNIPPSTSRSKVELIDDTQIVIKSREKHPVVLAEGHHSWPFHFHILDSRKMPSTYTESSKGSITYTLQAELTRYAVLSDVRAKVPIRICNPTFADITHYLKPYSFESEKMVGACCYGSGVVIAAATIDKSVILLRSGDEITISFRIDNLTHKFIYPEVYIQEHVIFIVPYSSKETERIVYHVSAPPVSPHTRKNVIKQRVGPLPEDLPGTVTSTSNINISYSLTIWLKGCGIKTTFRLTIGVQPEIVEENVEA